MRCRSCGAVNDDPSSVTCVRCGASLAPPETEATERIESSTVELTDTPPDGDSDALGPPRTKRSEDAFGPRRALYDSIYAARRALSAGGWFDAASAAAVGFLALLCVGLVFLVAARLQHPDLSASTNPWSVLTSIVVVALGSLRVPIHVGDITITALPFGALLLSAAAVSWAVEPAIRRREVTRLRPRVAAGAKIALPFALICCAAALVFRFREGATPTHAGAPSAFFLGAVWGTLFGALSGVRSHGALRKGLRSAARWLRARSGRLFPGLEAGGTMLLFSFLAASGAGLLWVIVALARGAPVQNFGAGDAFAGFLYVLAFLPNVLVAIIAVGMGAPLDVGAQVTIGGRQIGPLKTISLWDWGGGTPLIAFGFVLVPLVALGAAGYLARRRAAGRGALRVVLPGALLFAVSIALLAWLGQARLGAGIIRNRGFAVIAAEPAWVLAVGFAWALGAGFVGWKIAERRNRRAESEPERTEISEGAA